MDKYILFGAGQLGKEFISLLGNDRIKFFVDNDKKKTGNYLEGIPICHIDEVQNELLENPIIITVSLQYQAEVRDQLQRIGAKLFQTISEWKMEGIQKKISSKVNYIDVYKKTIEWVHKNSIKSKGIICNTNNRKSYPEVTGYFIPTLLRWGHRDLALSYAKWLCRIQKEDGSWYDVESKAPYVFDTAQIIKGLLAIREIYPNANDHIKKGCNWIINNIQDTGELLTPSKDEWGTKETCSELVHLYCLSPLIEASSIFHISEYKEKAYKVLNFYKNNYYSEIIEFSLLSHFYAYVIEGLLDLNEYNLVKIAMKNIERFQSESGAIPAYHNVKWVCSTGLFQLAGIWYRLGDPEHGNRAFEYACKLQNKTGGWYGSYLSENSFNEVNNYFPASEISWAAKYFLDALYYKNNTEFDK